MSVAIAMPAHAASPLDADGNNSVEASTDGMLLLRYLFRLRGQPLIDGAIGAGATRADSPAIEAYLASVTSGSTLDVDGNGRVEALTDGLMIWRFLQGARGSDIVAGAIGTGATRTSPTDIQNFIAALLSTGQAAAPSNCSVATSPPSAAGAPLPPGTTVTLTASCASGSPPITYSWNGGASVGASITVSPASTTNYTLVASNSGGSAPTISRAVYIQSGSGYCQSTDDQYDVFWPASGQIRQGSIGMTNQVSVFRLTIPTTFNPPLNINHTGAVHIAEVPGRPAIAREVTISNQPCDFHAPPGNYIWDDIGQQNGGGFVFTVNNPTGYQAVGADVNFQSGQTVYINVRNWYYNFGNPVPTCPAGMTCDLLFDFATPNRF